MRREITLRGGENKRRSTSNVSYRRDDPGTNFNSPYTSRSDNEKYKLSSPTVNAVVPRHNISTAPSIYTRNSGSIGKGFGSCMAKPSYTVAPTITMRIAQT